MTDREPSAAAVARSTTEALSSGGREPVPDLDVDDRWLTVAEVADELRVNAATVRLWVSKGTLRSTRPGERKSLVRRSDLDRMLAAPPVRGRALIDPSLFVRCVELFLSEHDITQEALLAELDAVLAHVREALLTYWRGRQPTTAREREP